MPGLKDGGNQLPRAPIQRPVTGNTRPFFIRV
jgi:hypothetical protein